MLKKNLDRLIADSGLFAQEVARIMEMPLSTLSDMKSGNQSNPTLENLIKLAACFNTSIEGLLYTRVKYTPINTAPKMKYFDYAHILTSRLLVLIDESKLTVAEVTRRSGLPRSTIENLLKAPLKNVRLNTVAPLARLFQVSLDELIGLTPIKKRNAQVTYSKVTVKANSVIPILRYEQVYEWIQAHEHGSKFPVNYVMLLSNKVIPCSFSFIAPSFMNAHWEENAVALVDIKKKFKRGGFILALISGEVRILLCKTTARFIDMQNTTEYHKMDTVIGSIVAVLPN